MHPVLVRVRCVFNVEPHLIGFWAACETVAWSIWEKMLELLMVAIHSLYALPLGVELGVVINVKSCHACNASRESSIVHLLTV